ncbi:hypothetical protein CL654_00630 [bacterium]|nr:hypothetical protein [bacterium]|tara:strand:+ start:1105 stop:1440 length:336 start_codon:yes stop_codon:yes gene_type:complete
MAEELSIEIIDDLHGYRCPLCCEVLIEGQSHISITITGSENEEENDSYILCSDKTIVCCGIAQRMPFFYGSSEESLKHARRLQRGKVNITLMTYANIDFAPFAPTEEEPLH